MTSEVQVRGQRRDRSSYSEPQPSLAEHLQMQGKVTKKSWRVYDGLIDFNTNGRKIFTSHRTHRFFLFLTTRSASRRVTLASLRPSACNSWSFYIRSILVIRGRLFVGWLTKPVGWLTMPVGWLTCFVCCLGSRAPSSPVVYPFQVRSPLMKL